MEVEKTESTRKRTKLVEDKVTLTEGAIAEVAEEDAEANPPVSEQMEVYMNPILEKIDNFTQQVSELLESGKTYFRELSTEFEERVIVIHKEQMETWQDEIKELRFLDASNEEINALYFTMSIMIPEGRNYFTCLKSYASRLPFVML